MFLALLKSIAMATLCVGVTTVYCIVPSKEFFFNAILTLLFSTLLYIYYQWWREDFYTSE